jgi:hypothetical protein
MGSRQGKGAPEMIEIRGGEVACLNTDIDARIR